LTTDLKRAGIFPKRGMDPVLLEKWSLTMTNLFRTLPGGMTLREQRRFSPLGADVEKIRPE
jgi:hypothetical protein